MPDNNDKYILSSVDNVLSVLNLFFAHEELSATEISNLLGVNRSSIFRFLVTLERRGYLTKDETSKYRLGIKLFTLGQLARSRMELNRVIHPYLEQLSEESGETSHLIIIEDTDAVFTDRSLGTSALKMDTPLGKTYPAHTTAGGKAVLAFADEDDLAAYIEKADFRTLSPASITTPDELLKVLSAIRKNGFSVDAEEAEIGLTCYAVPITDELGKAICAVSISGPTTRMQANKDKLISLLKEKTGEIAGKLK